MKYKSSARSMSRHRSAVWWNFAAVAACAAAVEMAGDGVNYLMEGTLHRPVGRSDKDLHPLGGWVPGSVPMLRTIGSLCGMSLRSFG